MKYWLFCYSEVQILGGGVEAEAELMRPELNSVLFKTALILMRILLYDEWSSIHVSQTNILQVICIWLVVGAWMLRCFSSVILIIVFLQLSLENNSHIFLTFSRVTGRKKTSFGACLLSWCIIYLWLEIVWNVIEVLI